MIFVGDHVKIKHAETHHIGTVLTVNANGQMTVEFKYPFVHRYYATEDMLYKVTDKVWYDYLGLEAKESTGNYVIDHAVDSTSIEHQIDELLYCSEDYYEGSTEMLQESFNNMYEAYLEMTGETESLKPYNGSDQTYLNVKEREDLKAMYIELALMTNDESWFNELTKGESK